MSETLDLLDKLIRSGSDFPRAVLADLRRVREAVERLERDNDALCDKLAWLWAHVPFWSYVGLRSEIEKALPDAAERYTRNLEAERAALRSGEDRDA